MQTRTLRTLIILVAIIGSLIYIYPTIGWSMLSEEEQQARLEQWRADDRIYREPNLFGEMWRGITRWAAFDRDMVINLGLDLQGGITMVVGVDPDSIDEEVMQEYLDNDWTRQEVVSHIRDMAKRTIERRINEFEAKEPVIQNYGDSQIQIQLPGEKDKERATELIMRTAYLSFHLVPGPQETTEIFQRIEDRFPRQFLQYLRPSQRGGAFEFDARYFDNIRSVVEDAREAGIIPEDKMIRFSKPPQPWETDNTYELYLLERHQLMSGEHLRQAVARPDTQSVQGNYMILFEFDATGARQFGEVTEENIGRAMAIVVDNVVESAPVIRGKITASGQISGDFSQQDANDLAIALNSGSMPARITEDSTGFVGATLGADSIRKGVFSAIVGLVLVIFFMLVYYRMAGVIANLCLVANGIIVLGMLAYFGATLTLPGIAGLILTIGMAVDANVLIYERIREELRNGRSLLASIDNGFQRAQITILDANVTTLIAAAVLYQFGTGPIEGFAVALMIGVVSSVFTALVMGRALFDFFAEKNLLGKLHMMSILKPETKVQFMSARQVMLAASAIVIVVGIVATGARSGSRHGMLGVDFTEGTNVVVNLHGDDPVDVGEVRTALIDDGFREPIVQEYEREDRESLNRFLIRISEVAPAEAAAEDEAPGGEITVDERVAAALEPLAQGAGPDGEAVDMERVETVGPAVGQQLRWNALEAIAYSLVFIIAYIWFRFEWRFSLGAVAALVHDVAITVGIFALTGKQITLPVVAAILTIIGYSLNDTIVVFDRIREDLRLYRGRGLSYPEIMNLSINQTLSRTLLTSATTLIVVIVLFVFGGEVINDFAFALIVGVLVGTYSSIFVASPVVHYLQKWFGGGTHAHIEDKHPAQRRRKIKKSDANAGEGEATA